jgi:hypothetical protein
VIHKKRVLVLTGMTDNVDVVLNEPVKMTPVYDATLSSKERYARRHSYDFMSLRSFGNDSEGLLGDEITDETTIRGTGFLRVLRAFQMLNFYDYVMWIDGDSLITNDNYTIEDFEMGDKVFCASYDWEWKRSFSTGNFIMQKNEHTQILMQHFFAIARNKNCPHEQAALNYIHRAKETSHLFKVHEHRYLGAIPSNEIHLECCNTDRTVLYPWNSDCFLVHLTGLDNQSRMNILNTHFKSYM